VTYQDVLNSDRAKFLNTDEFAVTVTYQKPGNAAQTGVVMVLGQTATVPFVEELNEGRSETVTFTFSLADITNAATGDLITYNSVVYKLARALEEDPYMETWEATYKPVEKRHGRF